MKALLILCLIVVICFLSCNDAGPEETEPVEPVEIATIDSTITDSLP